MAARAFQVPARTRRGGGEIEACPRVTPASLSLISLSTMSWKEPVPGPLKLRPTRPRTVLAVDDDPELRSALRELLQEEGYSIETVANGAEARAVLDQGLRPGLVVLDVHMPVMSGLELLRELRADPSLRRLVVCVLTADAGLVPATADHVLRKPLSVTALLALVRRHCDTSSVQLVGRALRSVPGA
jgi:CheY-like chemotaxis protein